MKFITNPNTRKWLYKIATTLLIVLAGYGVLDASQTDNIAMLISAILNLGGAGVTAVAHANTDSSDNIVA